MQTRGLVVVVALGALWVIVGVCWIYLSASMARITLTYEMVSQAGDRNTQKMAKY